MLTHDVSNMPMSLKTPSRISLITSGGALKDLISDNASDLIFPTADLAKQKHTYSLKYNLYVQRQKCISYTWDNFFFLITTLMISFKTF